MGEISVVSQDINIILRGIEEIAFKTNQLADKAASELTLADHEKKGAAVVADEIRSLAARSVRIARETTELIEASTREAANGTQLTELISNSLEKIVVSITQITDLVGKIAAASIEREQSVAPKDQQATLAAKGQTHSAKSETYTATAAELSSQSEQLKKMLYRFQLSNIHPAPAITIIPRRGRQGIDWTYRQEFYDDELSHLNNSEYERF